VRWRAAGTDLLLSDPLEHEHRDLASGRLGLVVLEGGQHDGLGVEQAAPLVAGAAALLLERDPTMTPAQVADALFSAATSGAVTNIGATTANRLLYIAPDAPPPPPPPATTTTTTTTTTVAPPPAAPGVNERLDGVRLAIRLYRSPNEVAVYSRPFTDVLIEATPLTGDGDSASWIVRTNSVGYTKFSTRRNLAVYNVSARIHRP